MVGGDLVSILRDVGNALGLIEDDSSFDAELTMHVNASLSTLYQNGVGTPFQIEDNKGTWEDFMIPELVENDYMSGQIKQYVFLKTKILFDPPPPSSVEHVSRAADEMLWRLRENYDVLKEE